MEIIIASILGTALGLFLASGTVGKKLSSSVFTSARRAVNLEKIDSKASGVVEVRKV